jgi:hypothetical protein
MRHKITNTLTLMISTALCLLLAEFGLALLFPIPHSIEVNMYFEPDPFTGYKLKANSVGHFRDGIEGRANSRGHRDDEIEPKPPAGGTRIMVLGDSFTVGANVRQDEVYPQVLEQILADRCAAAVDVVNTAVGGWCPFQYAQYYEHYGAALDPDLVIVCFFVGNDSFDKNNQVHQLLTAVGGRRVHREAAEESGIRLKIFLYEHSHLVRLVISRLGGASVVSDREFWRTDCSDLSEQFIEIQRHRLQNHFRWNARQERIVQNNIDQIARIHRLTQSQHIPLLVVLIPDESQINPILQSKLLADTDPTTIDFDMPQPLLAAKMFELGVPVIDLLADFRADGRCLYMNDTHWNADGHRLAAEILTDNLIEAGLVTGCGGEH